MKIFDEIVSNAVDEHRRNPKLDELRVTVDPGSGMVKVWDNGGIPVVKHAEYDEWVPEMIFSNLKAGSNFNDDEERLVAGTNGVGSTLTNIFSVKFRVRTSDGKNAFEQTFSNNMRERTEAKVIKWKEKFTEITFRPDLARFGLESIDADHLEMMRRRCIDLAACNPKLRVSFNGIERKFPTFQDYCKLYNESVIYEETDRWKVGIAPSAGSFMQVSFVNSVETKDGGAHVDYVMSQIIEWLREKVKRKHKLDLRPAELRNHFFLFVQADIVNPAFSSQTKEKMITEPKEFGSKFEISEKTLKAIMASEVVQRILDWAQQKALADERKQLRELNRNLDKGKVLKLIDAKGKERDKCTLGLFEGDSAVSFFRKFRDPNSQGAFPLRGKFINVTELPNTRVIQNQEVKDLLVAIGLKMGEEPKNLRYGKILIYTDADVDGSSIAGLLLNFFGRYWPELFEQGRICRVETPLVVVKRKDEKISFYNSNKYSKRKN
jgi:DNA topoisomerase-2